MSINPDGEENNDTVVPPENLKERPDEMPSAADISANELVFPVFMIQMMDHIHDHIRLSMDTLIELEGDMQKRFDKIDERITDDKKATTVRDFVLIIAAIFILGLLL